MPASSASSRQARSAISRTEVRRPAAAASAATSATSIAPELPRPLPGGASDRVAREHGAASGAAGGPRATARAGRRRRAPRHRGTRGRLEILRDQDIPRVARHHLRVGVELHARRTRPRRPRARSRAARRSTRRRSRAAPAPPRGTASRRDPPLLHAGELAPQIHLHPFHPPIRPLQSARVIEKCHRHRVREEALRRRRIRRRLDAGGLRQRAPDSRVRCRPRCRARRRRSLARVRRPAREKWRARAAGSTTSNPARASRAWTICSSAASPLPTVSSSNRVGQPRRDRGGTGGAGAFGPPEDIRALRAAPDRSPACRSRRDSPRRSPRRSIVALTARRVARSSNGGRRVLNTMP